MKSQEPGASSRDANASKWLHGPTNALFRLSAWLVRTVAWLASVERLSGWSIVRWVGLVLLVAVCKWR